ncbi:hypothetical protein JCM10207_004861 [Rhodosporidiobolus poonsookiae]
MPARTIAVLGSTGNQGGGVVAALLASPSPAFSVLALTRDPSSGAAKALLAEHKDAVDAGRLRLVQADLNDRGSLEAALGGAEGVFAAFTESDEETEQGKRLVDAAKATGIQHFVYSTLPSLARLTSGKIIKAKPFELKEPVALCAEEQLPNVTLVAAGAFYSNFSSPFYAYRDADDTVVFCSPLKEGTGHELLDPSYDMGQYVSAIFSAPLATVKGKTYAVSTRAQTLPEIAEEYERATGEKAVARPRSLEDAVAAVAKDAESAEMWTEMYTYLGSLPPGSRCYGSMKPEEDTAAQDLGVRASTLTEYLERTGYRVPRKKEEK